MEIPRDLQGKHSQSSGSEFHKSAWGGDRSDDSQVNSACREPRDPGGQEMPSRARTQPNGPIKQLPGCCCS